MKKIKFGDTDSLGRIVKEPIAKKSDWDILAFFISETKYTVQETITILESIEKGEQTFQDVELEYSWGIGDYPKGAGEFSCNAETAYFKAVDTGFESMEMPLKELIEILYEWKDFLGEQQTP